MNSKAFEHFTRARTSLLLDHYFFGRLSLHLKPVEDEACKTLAVDGKHIFYNPEFILGLSVDLMKSAIVHEIGHCMFDHMSRRGGRDSRKWNVAGDYVINEMLERADFRLGKEWLRDRQYDGMSAEHVYDLLPKGQGQGQGQDQSLQPLDEIRDAQDPVELAPEWQIAVAQAAFMAKGQGKLPKGLERFIEETTAPKVPWREVLQQFITQLSKDDYVWSRPNKKFVGQGIYLPSLYSEHMGEIAIVIDTSGSIDQPTLNTFGTEIQAIVGSCRPIKTTVVYCDAAVNHVDEFAPDDILEFNMHGGGGTDLRVAIDHLNSSDKPVCCVVLTDGYTPYGEAPEYPVLWCMTTNVVAPFGETLRIEV